jgi:WD40 repeat protein/serine/threonine protein kinase
MSEMVRQEHREPAAGGGASAPTLVATRLVANLLPAPSGPGSSTRYVAARLPVVDRDAYEIAGEVARGGIGRILRAHSVHLGRPVAIKELLVPGDAAEERFVCEALVTARLQHPSIVSVYEAGRWPTGELFYAMKLVSGRSLADVLEDPHSTDGEGRARTPRDSAPRESAPSTPPRVRAADPEAPPAKTPRSFSSRLALLPHVIAVADAMAYAHSERIIHRDLKPANVLVGKFGETVVIDWGLAKDLAVDHRSGLRPGEPGFAPSPSAPPEPPPPGAAPSTPPPSSGERAATRKNGSSSGPEGLTVAGAVIGTPTYMPPEQARGLPVDERADVYAIGAILYHVLAGVPPYEGGDARAVLRAVAAGPPPPLAARERRIPVELSTIVGKAMARDPADRYPTARELAEDLRRFTTGQIVGAHKYTRAELARRFVRRYRALISVAAAALTVVVAIGVVAMRRNMAERDRAAARQVEAEAARSEATRRADALTLVQARASAARDPNQSLTLLGSLSPSFDAWTAARVIAADARSHGLAVVLRGHAEYVNDVSFSPDGKRVATASDDRTARIWDLATGESKVLSGHTDEVWRARFVLGGKVLATASKDKTIRLWDTATGAAIATLAGHEAGVGSIAPTADGRSLISSDHGGMVRIWDLETHAGHVVGRSRVAVHAAASSADGRRAVWISGAGDAHTADLETGRDDLLHDVLRRMVVATALMPDGRLAAARGVDGTVMVYDLTTRAVHEMAGPLPDQKSMSELEFSPDGNQIAFGEGTAVVLADTSTGARRVLDGREAPVYHAWFSPDGKHVAAACADHALQLWDLETGEVRTLHGFDDNVVMAAFSPDSRQIAACNADHSTRVFPVEAGDGRVIGTHGPRLISASLSPEGDLLAAGDEAGAIVLWDPARPGAASVQIDGHVGPVHDVAFSPDGAVLASAGGDEALRLWDRRGAPIAAFPLHAGEARALVFSADGKHLAWGGDRGAIGVLDLGADHRPAGEPRWLHGGNDVKALAFSPDGQALAAGGEDRIVRVWQLSTGEEKALAGHDDYVAALAFSPDGKTLVSGAHDHTLRYWDLATSTSRLVDAGGGGVTQVAFSRDGATLYTLSLVETGVRLWDARTGKQLRVLRGHNGGVLSFALSPDGGRIATASYDTTARIWDLATGESRDLRGHTAPVAWVAFSPDGGAVLTGGADHTLRTFADDLPTDPAEIERTLSTR